MTREGLRRSDSFSEITPAPETTLQQEQSEPDIDSKPTFEETLDVHSSITSHHEEQASSGNKSRSCLSSISDITPMPFLKAGIGFSSTVMATSAGVLIFNNNPDNYTSVLGTNKTIEHPVASTDEFTRTFVSLMILSTLSCLSFYGLYQAKNAKEAKQKEEQEQRQESQTNKDELSSMSPDQFKAFSEKDVSNNIPTSEEKSTQQEIHKYDLEALKLEILGMDQDKFKIFFKAHHDILSKDDRENIVRAHLQQLRAKEEYAGPETESAPRIRGDLIISSHPGNVIINLPANLLERESAMAPYFSQKR